MKFVYLLLSLVLFSITLNSQTKPKTQDLGNIVFETTGINEQLGFKPGLQPIMNSKSVIEIRLYSNIGFPQTQCIVLQYDKGWKATKFKIGLKDSCIKTMLKPIGGIDKIVRAIMESNVFSLPTQSRINPANYKLDPVTNEIKPSAMIVSDAACYYVQFKVQNDGREYKYCDPKAYAAFYKGQHEYADFAAILKQFEKLEVK